MRTVIVIFQIFGATLPTDKLMRYVKVWLPATVKPGYISHSIFNIQVNMAVKKKSKSISAKVSRGAERLLLMGL